jgi:cell division protein FtsB
MKRKTYASQRRRSLLRNNRLLLFWGVVAVGALFLLGQFGDAGIASWWKLRSEEAKLEAEVAALEAENTALQQRLKELQSNPEALEKLAREQHEMRGPDEEVLTVIDPVERAGGNAD